MVGGDGAMHYAAALSVLIPSRRGHSMFQHHLEQMKEATKTSSLLGKNFKAIAGRYPQLLKHFRQR